MRILIIISIFNTIISYSIIAQYTPAESLMSEYILLNNTENRLIDFKDSDEDLRLKLIQLQLINNSRKKHRAAPVRLDIHASRLANKICREAAENDYVGHWNMKGEKPYHRYSFAGGQDHISENASGNMTSGGFENSSESILKLMKANHQAFMSERKPNDGHKETVIAKDHNYVGIGFYLTINQFRYYEEFIDRYYEFEDVPEVVNRKEAFKLKLRTTGKLNIHFLVAYWEREPSPMSPRQIMSRSVYNDFTNNVALQIPPWEMNKYKQGDWYIIPMNFKRSGLYYIQIYSDNMEYDKGKKYSTKGKLQASGIVIRVR